MLSQTIFSVSVLWINTYISVSFVLIGFLLSEKKITYVNRILAFIFATDESFTKLMELPKTPFRMWCGNQLCINLAHISLGDSDKEFGYEAEESESGEEAE